MSKVALPRASKRRNTCPRQPVTHPCVKVSTGKLRSVWLSPMIAATKMQRLNQRSYQWIGQNMESKSYIRINLI
jgi:hypothetical protein